MARAPRFLRAGLLHRAPLLLLSAELRLCAAARCLSAAGRDARPQSRLLFPLSRRGPRALAQSETGAAPGRAGFVIADPPAAQTRGEAGPPRIAWAITSTTMAPPMATSML